MSLSRKTELPETVDAYPVNILRKKTFNEELRGLVNKVTGKGHKQLAPQGIDINALLNSLSENELIASFHELFYKTKNLEQVKDANVFFDPYAIADHSIESLSANLEEELYRHGIEEFAVLSYNLVDKAYTCIHNRIPTLDSKNIYISRKDQLYKKISQQPHGYVLMPDEIASDPFLQKKFISSEVAELAYFFIMFKYLTGDIRHEISPNLHDIHLSQTPSSILMVPVFPGQSIPVNELSTKLSMQFLLLEKERLWEDEENMTFEKKTAVLEYLLSVFCELEDYIGVIFTFKKNVYKEMYYINRYLKSKLYNNLPSESIIMSVAKNRTVVFVHQSLENTIYSLVKDYNTFLSNTELDVFTVKECANTGAIMRKFFRY